jgi:hypothetical protein
MAGPAAKAEGVNGELGTTSAERRHNMSAAILKRKLRNFPSANLTIRTAGA